MCRFVLYMGPDIKMGSLVTEPEHSIIVQSYHSEERTEPLNGDGFGVAWYASDKTEPPAVFKSVSPAWNNQNLLNLSRVIHSQCFLAHVRAASPGLPVTRLNCHPFSWQQFCFMHNGNVGNFQSIKRRLRNSLSDESYDWIKGSTDSESIFALFIDIYTATKAATTIERMSAALLATIKSVESQNAATEGFENSSGCDLNLVISNGECAVVSRYSSTGRTPNTLYLHSGHRYSCEGGTVKLTPCEEGTVLVASEPLTEDASWHAVEPNHMLIINSSFEVDIQPIIL